MESFKHLQDYKKWAQWFHQVPFTPILLLDSFKCCHVLDTQLPDISTLTVNTLQKSFIFFIPSSPDIPAALILIEWQLIYCHHSLEFLYSSHINWHFTCRHRLTHWSETFKSQVLELDSYSANISMMSAAWSTTDAAAPFIVCTNWQITYRYVNTVQTFLNSSSISELQIQPAPELL